MRDYYNGYGGKKQGEDSRGKFAAGEILNPLGGFRGAACSGIMGTKISGRSFPDEEDNFCKKSGVLRALHRAVRGAADGVPRDRECGPDLPADAYSRAAVRAGLQEASRRVKKAMDRLPEKEYMVLDSIYIGCQEAAQVAQQLHVSTSHIYRLQKSGVRRVRGMLSRFIHQWK